MIPRLRTALGLLAPELSNSALCRPSVWTSPIVPWSFYLYGLQSIRSNHRSVMTDLSAYHDWLALSLRTRRSECLDRTDLSA